MYHCQLYRSSWQKKMLLTLLCTGLWAAFWPGRSLWDRHDTPWLLLSTSAEAKEGEDIAAFMIRNAYHFATLYHAVRAGQWELAAYQGEELEENLEDTERAAPTYAPLLQQFRKDTVTPLQQAIATRNTPQFDTAFRSAVHGCNNCHIATGHAFIIIPPDPPQLSIFALPPASR
jgi:hypothetical protein